MKRLIVLLAAAVFPACGGMSIPEPLAEGLPLREDLALFLTRSGYSQVTMTRLPTGHFAVAGSADSVAFDMIIDTGASHTLIDTERAPRFGLEMEDNGNRATGLGVSSQLVQNARLDNVEIGSMRFDTLQVRVLDLSQVNQVLESLGNAPIDGILGADVLTAQQAVIDYGSLNLYFRD